MSDVEHLATLDGPDDLHLSLQEIRRDDGMRLDAGEGLRLKLYRQLDDIPLSDAMPMMENMGLRVISERPYRLQVGETPVYIQDFEVESTAGKINAAHADAGFGEAFERIWNGDAENDGFNRLILAAGLHWRQVALLRGYCKYLLQTAVPFSQAYVEATFTRYPLLARLLVELFEARFDPPPARRPRRRSSPARNVCARNCRYSQPATRPRSRPWSRCCRHVAATAPRSRRPPAPRC